MSKTKVIQYEIVSDTGSYGIGGNIANGVFTNEADARKAAISEVQTICEMLMNVGDDDKLPDRWLPQWVVGYEVSGGKITRSFLLLAGVQIFRILA